MRETLREHYHVFVHSLLIFQVTKAISLLRKSFFYGAIKELFFFYNNILLSFDTNELKKKIHVHYILSSFIFMLFVSNFVAHSLSTLVFPLRFLNSIISVILFVFIYCYLSMIFSGRSNALLSALNVFANCPSYLMHMRANIFDK